MTLAAIQPTFTGATPAVPLSSNVSTNNELSANATSSVTHSATQENNTSLIKEADKQLAELYRQVLLRFSSGESALEPAKENLPNIPENSTFGKWRSLMSSLFKSPDFTLWAKENKIDLSRGIRISPRDQCIVAISAGKSVHFNNANFSAFPLFMKVAEAFSPLSSTTYNPNTVSVKEVAKFYGITVPEQDAANTLNERARASAAELEDGTAFSEFSHSSLRSESELKLNQSALATINDKQEFIRLLKTFPKEGSQQLSDFLHETTFNAHSAAAPGQDVSIDTPATVSLAQYISQQNWQLPTTADEVDYLLNALTTPALRSPKYADFGGALSWSPPLSGPQARNPYIILSSQLDEPGPGGLLGYLSSNRHWEPYELRNPRRVIEQILESPKAQALGQVLQQTEGAVSTATSASDYLLAAIHASFEPQLTPSRTNVAGFELAQPGNSGLTASAIVKRLADHLSEANSSNGDSRVSEALAPIAAHLLLSKRAPEFLVKDIPDGVTYGSQAWLTFSTAVARVEAEAPGATATMKYADILSRGDIARITPEQQQVEQNAKLAALMDWGVANSLIALNPTDDYTTDQKKLVLAALQQQMTEILQAFEAKTAPLPMRKDIAADQLYEGLGFSLSENQPYFNALMSKLGIPGASTEQYRESHGEKAAFYDFINTKFIKTTHHNKDFPGPYSLLDLHI